MTDVGIGEDHDARPRHRPSLLPVDMPDEVARPAAHLLVDPSDVLADDPDARHEHAHDDEGEREEREDALGLGGVQQDEAPHEQVGAEEDAAAGGDEAEEREELQRDDGESRHQVEVQADEPIERILALARACARRARPCTSAGRRAMLWASAGMKVECSSLRLMSSTTSREYARSMQP